MPLSALPYPLGGPTWLSQNRPRPTSLRGSESAQTPTQQQFSEASSKRFWIDAVRRIGGKRFSRRHVRADADQKAQADLLIGTDILQEAICVVFAVGEVLGIAGL